MLKALTTYRAFDTIVSPADGGKQQVAITYDAVNSYNAPIRGTFFCSFDIGSGLADEAEGVAASFGEAPLGQLDLPAAATPSPTDPAHTVPTPRAEVDPPDEIPVCDQPDSPAKFALMNEIGTDCTGE